MAKAKEVPGLSADLPFRDAAAAIVRVRTGELFAAADDVLDVTEPEGVHAMRVASRRLRAILEIAAPCFDRDALRPVLRDVKALADALGARRDPDVELIALEGLAAAMGPSELVGIDFVADRVREEQAQGNVVLETALRAAHESDLRGRLFALADGVAS